MLYRSLTLIRSFGVIYKVTNILNSFEYIGQTIRSLDERKKECD